LNRWLVGFDDEPWPDEDINENRFGEILGKAEVPPKRGAPAQALRNRKASNATSSATTRKPNARINNKKQTTPSPAVTPNADASRELSPSSSNDDHKTGNSKKKRVVFLESAGSGVPGSDVSSSPVDDKRAAAKSARAQRSKRRQAEPLHFPEHISRPPPKKSKTSNKQKEDAVRIPMLTGTLFLYRGPHRRAEFVRKV
jgi:hypothetical protein